MRAGEKQGSGRGMKQRSSTASKHRRRRGLMQDRRARTNGTNRLMSLTAIWKTSAAMRLYTAPYEPYVTSLALRAARKRIE